MCVDNAKCGNSEPGTFNHECGAPATWVGLKKSELTKSGIFYAAFCDMHKERGWDRSGVIEWRPFLPGIFVNEWK